MDATKGYGEYSSTDLRAQRIQKLAGHKSTVTVIKAPGGYEKSIFVAAWIKERNERDYEVVFVDYWDAHQVPDTYTPVDQDADLNVIRTVLSRLEHHVFGEVDLWEPAPKKSGMAVPATRAVGEDPATTGESVGSEYAPPGPLLDTIEENTVSFQNRVLGTLNEDTVQGRGTRRPSGALPLELVSRLQRISAHSVAYAKPIALVLDGFAEQLTDSALPARFISSIARVLPTSRVLIVARTDTRLETTLPLLCDCMVIGPAVLRQSVGDIQRYAGRLGFELSEQEAADLFALSSGWPALVKALLSNASRESTGLIDLSVGERAAVDYLRDHFQTQPSALSTLFLIAVAALESFTVETARAMLNSVLARPQEVLAAAFARELTQREWQSIAQEVDLNASQALVRSLEVVGLVQREPTDAHLGEPQYSVTELARSAVYSLFDRLETSTRSDLLRVVGQDVVQRSTVKHAMTVLVAFRDWPGISDLLESKWIELLDMPSREVRMVLDKIPSRAAQDSMKVLAMNLSWKFEGDDNKRRQSLSLLTELILQRAEAPQPDNLPQEIDELNEAQYVALIDYLNAWGLSRLLRGELRFAGLIFRLTRRLILRSSIPALLSTSLDELVVYEASLKLLTGAVEDVLLDQERIKGIVQRDVQPLSGLATVALDWLRTTTLNPALCDCFDRDYAFDGFSVIANLSTTAHTHCLMVAGSAKTALVQMEKTINALPCDGRYSLARNLLLDSYIHMLMSEGKLSEARNLLGEDHGNPVWFYEANARLAFLSGSFDEAIAVVQAALVEQREIPRQQVALLTILAASQCELGDLYAAQENLRAAYRLASKHHLWVYFALIPRTTTQLLFESQPECLAEIESRVDGHYVDFPRPHQIRALSVKEREVLAALTQYESINATARALFLGVNTVKTHKRNIYRKLGIHSLEEAKSFAREIGL